VAAALQRSVVNKPIAVEERQTLGGAEPEEASRVVDVLLMTLLGIHRDRVRL